MAVYTRADMYAEFEFPDEPAHDFEVGGVPAQYASGHPKKWNGGEDEINFAADANITTDIYKSYSSAISPDQKLLAIATRNQQILIYDINSQELRQVLNGAGPLEFRPEVYQDDVEEAVQMQTKKHSAHSKPAYTLVSGVSTDAASIRRKSLQIILWELDQHGRNLFEEEPIDTMKVAKKAMKAVTSELVGKHEWDAEFITASTLHAEFSEALQRVAVIHSRRHQVIFDKASFGSCGASSFSHDGKLLKYHIANESTQHGMRDATKLPAIALYDLDAAQHVRQLTGHTDSIMWSGFSPCDAHIASVSWDGSLRMYSASTGDLAWATEKHDEQAWAGAFSPDSQYIAWSSRTGRTVQVHRVSDGTLLATFPALLRNWCRCLVWHPSRNELALCADQNAWIWDPFEGGGGGAAPNGRIWQHFEMNKAAGPLARLVEIMHVAWLDEGRLLCVEISEGTKVVYDTQSNVKEMFKRPLGAKAGYVSGSLYGPLQMRDQAEFYLSVDGDGKSRYWRSSVASYPSWWDKEKEKEVVVGGGANEKVFPETGKYVKVVKKGEGSAREKAREQEAWAEKGAELWTAQ